MITKVATYLVVIAILLMLTPSILSVFGVKEVMEDPFYPMLTILLGGVGVLLHAINLFIKKEFSINALALLSSVLFVVLGVSLSTLGYESMKYMTLLGLLIIAFWIAIPQKENKEKADQD
jgi:peptidoglycan/LPS O-acetylase OafA/YrhL